MAVGAGYQQQQSTKQTFQQTPWARICATVGQLGCCGPGCGPDPQDDLIDDSFALYSKATGEQRFDQPIIDGDVEPAMRTPTFGLASDISDHLLDVMEKGLFCARFSESSCLHTFRCFPFFPSSSVARRLPTSRSSMRCAGKLEAGHQYNLRRCWRYTYISNNDQPKCPSLPACIGHICLGLCAGGT